jgi:CheY-like chemotaxis protein
MTTGALVGLTILVVEDEYFIADELERNLSAAGAHVVGPVGAADEALDLVSSTDSLDFALLDLNLNGDSALPIADRLVEAGVPFAFVSGYGAGAIPARFANAPFWGSPRRWSPSSGPFKRAAMSNSSPLGWAFRRRLPPWTRQHFNESVKL